MNVRAIVPLIAGLAIAGVAGKLGLDYLGKVQAGQVKQVQIWAAAADIPRGTAIAETMLKPVTFPVTAIPPGAFKDKAKLVGRVPQLVAPANLPLLESMLSPEGTPPGIQVPPGLRAAAVKIDESSGVDNHLQPGVRVDVVGYFNIRGKNGQQTIARPIIEDCEVAAVGERISVGNTTGPEAAPEKGKSTRTEKPARAVTLLVKPEDVPRLHLAEQRGKIKLSMRSKLESLPHDPDSDDPNGDQTASKRQPRSVTDDDVLGLADNKENWLSGLIKQFAPDPNRPQTPVAPPPAVVKAEPPPPPKPKPVWEMRILNGDQIRRLAWMTMTSIEPIEVSAESETGGLFRDDKVRDVPADIPPGGDKPTTSSEPGSDPEPQDATETSQNTEPEESLE